MSKKRLFYVVMAMALLALGAITLRTAVATSAVGSTTHDGFDEVERTRSNFSANKSTDTSYDEVERIRAQFHPIGSTYLPFGPGLAATYGAPNDANSATDALPFGPGWAATYGVPAREQRRTNENATTSAPDKDVSSGSVRPPELYDPVRAPDLAGYWNAVSRSGAK